MKHFRWFQFRLRDIGWLSVVVGLVLALMLNHWRHRQSFSAMTQRFEREIPWAKWESNEPDWREATLRPDQFRLTVRRLVDDSDQLLVMLTIETLQPQWHAIWSRGTTWYGQSGGHAVSGTIEQRHRLDEYCIGNDTLTATQLSYQHKQLASMSLGGGSTTMEVPLKTKLNCVLEVTAKDGLYSLHEPIVIGSAFGTQIKLVVGDREKVDAMADTSTESPIAPRESNAE